MDLIDRARRALLGGVWALGLAAAAGCGGGGVESASGSVASPTLAGRYKLVSTPIGGFVDASFVFTPEGSVSGVEANGSFSGVWSPLFPGADRFEVRLTYVDARLPNAPITTEYTASLSDDAPPHLLLGTLFELIPLGPP